MTCVHGRMLLVYQTHRVCQCGTIGGCPCRALCAHCWRPGRLGHESRPCELRICWRMAWIMGPARHKLRKGMLCQGLNAEGTTFQREAVGTMSRLNNQITRGRRDTFLPSRTYRENHCSNGLMMQCNVEWWLHSHHVICVTGISVPPYDIEYFNRLALKSVGAWMIGASIAMETAQLGMPTPPRIGLMEGW